MAHTQKLRADPPPIRFLQHVLVIAIIAVAGYLAVSPAILGDFSSGDDVHLLRDHVLVNHPSLAHAVELFTIVHRDLYQPLLLLSFQLDFLFRGGDPQGMHATNVWLHLINAGLVYLFLHRVTRSWLIGAIAALLFVVHPISVESVAWLNGRTMLLSTGFLIAGMIAFEHFEQTRRWRWLVVALVMFVLTMMSKIRVELPALLILVQVAKCRWPDRRWWIGWTLATAVAAGFSAFALTTTSVSDMADIAAADMPGPPLARAFESLAWYFVHYMWPAGLSPWHPPRVPIAWSDPSVIAGILITFAVIVVPAAVFRWTRTPAVGIAWFLAAIFSTLQVVPTRAVLAGERYAYLPNIGLHWIVAAGAAYLILTAARTRWRVPATIAAAAPIVAIAIACVVVARATTAHYLDDLARARRIVEIYPDTEDVYKDLAWAYIRIGDTKTARDMAEKELGRPQSNRSAALQAVAWTHYLENDFAQAEAVLHTAIQVNPDYGKAHYRMGRVHEAQGRLDQAAHDYQQCLEITPTYLPALSDLARLYMKTGRLDDAEAVYRRILDQVNAYHVPAIYNLADIYMTQGRLELAVKKYEGLLSWLRSGDDAKNAATNLALCYERMGRVDDALATYGRVLAEDPTFPYALLNRAALLLRLDRPADAEEDYRTLLGADPKNQPALDAMQALLGAQGRFSELADLRMKSAQARRAPETEWNWVIWNLTLAGRDSHATELRAVRVRPDASSSLLDFAAAWRDISAGRFDDAEQTIRAACADGRTPPLVEINALTTALERASVTRPHDPWPFYFVGVVMETQGRPDVAALAYAECRSRAADPDWVRRAEAGLARVPRPSGTLPVTPG